MHVEHALGELGHLGDAAGNGYLRHRMAADIFQHAADEIAHVDQRDIGEVMIGLRRLFGRIAGGAGNVIEAGRARHIDAAPDGMDPGRARIRNDDPRRAEDRYSADNAEPAVERLLGDLLTVGHRNLHLEIGALAGNLCYRLRNHLPRHRVDRGFAGWQRQTGPRHRTDARSGLEGDAGCGRPAPYRAYDQRAMGDIWVVAGILDDASLGETLAHLFDGQRKTRPLAAGQGHLHQRRKFACHQRQTGSLRGRRSAGSRGPATSQGLAVNIDGGFHGRFYSPAFTGRQKVCTPCP